MALVPAKTAGTFSLEAWHRFHRRLRKKTSTDSLAPAGGGGLDDPEVPGAEAAGESCAAACAAAAPTAEADVWQSRLARHSSSSPLHVGADGGCQDAPRAEFLREELVWKNERKVQDEYLIEEVLGEGSFGKVHKAVHIRSGVHRAIKELQKVETLAEDFELELRALIELDHPHIVQVIEHFEEPDRWFIVMELCTGPDLFTYIVENTHVKDDAPHKFIPESRVSVILRQCLKAVLGCHAHGFVHRDLKAKNFLITGSDQTIKLIDFGLATRCLPNEEYEEIVGTAHYMAPEMMLNGQWTTAVDMWSLGVLLFVALTGTLLLPSDDEKKKKMLSAPGFAKTRLDKCKILRARGTSDSARSLLERMLAFDAASRITASQALSHPFILGHRAESLGEPLAFTYDFDRDVIRKMRRFARAPRFFKVVLLVMAHLASPQDDKDHEQDILRAEHTFRTMDQNGDGEIALEELRAHLEAHDLAVPSDMEELFRICNISQSGRLSHCEFLACALPAEVMDERLCSAVFNVLDRDYNGIVNAEDIQLAHPAYDRSVCELMVAEADIRKKGFLEFEDFQEFVLCASWHNASRETPDAQDGALEPPHARRRTA